MRIFLALAFVAGPVFYSVFNSTAMAADCPDPVDVAAPLSDLIAAARAAPDEAGGRDVGGQMWKLWLMAPNAQAQEVLDRGLRHRDGYDYAGAYADFDRLVTYCPTYAEGFNQRAYVQFLQGQFEGALLDLERALALLPNHVAAQSGRALTLMQLGRIKEARAQMLAALENNPWLSERALVAKGAPLGQKGEDI